ncbi:hypothetical protein IU438_06615 [Nocardia cyriacigeorgica]|nr:hypothetical protein [Nocardia cyriacigeorgica]MBF6160797.1 hypothetical protein [Nocardia cyriacigeorgica]MBF6201619.1 hypothetical protein [Nocardia cyriacigeorgica]MBF6395461.1 hypothetical protein [Nocardia cyriacigeorgica]MBF6401093.1 hypothetical protein [Nocardia cyriacigeorgica]
MSYPHVVAHGPVEARPAVIGLVREEVSGPHAVRHADEIRRYAIKSGRRYVYTVRPPNGNPDPVGYTLGIAAALGVDTIIVFDLAHTDNTPDRICDDGCNLETVCPATVWTPTTPTNAPHSAAVIARGIHEAGDTPCGPVSCTPRQGAAVGVA